jgi:hypothetical protein
MDAADWDNNEPGNQEYSGGKPFNINGAWTVRRTQSVIVEVAQ